MKKLYIVGGAMGVGKTSVCQQLKRDLPNSVFLDGDWCWDAHPFRVTEETKRMVVDNIVYLLNNFLKCAAYDNVIFCWVMHQQEIIDSIVSRLETQNCEVKTISLIADEASLSKRIRGDIQKGVRRPEDIQRSVDRLPLYRCLNTIKVDTCGRSIQQVADAVRAL